MQVPGSTDAVAAPVLVLGGANMDITAATSYPLQPGESIPGRIACTPGGVARNAAENLARLGRACGFISVVGDDAFGRQLLDATAAAGVDVSACLVRAGRTSSCYLSLQGPDGDMVLAVNDMGLLEALTPQALAGHAARLRAAAALLLDCNLSPELLEWLLHQPARGPAFVDAVSAFKAGRLRPWLARVHGLKLDRQEAAALSGRPVRTLSEARRAAAWLIGQGLQQVALSLGSQGVCWHDADGSHGVEPACRVSVVNSNGAGDALLAGLLHAHLRGEPLAQAIRFASGCAALTLTSAAANHPELSDASVRRLLDAARPKDSGHSVPGLARPRRQAVAKSSS